MKQLKKDLKAVTKSLKALTKKTESMAKEVDRLAKAQAEPRAKAKPRAAKKPAKKKAARAMTATDKVVGIIKTSKGTDVAAIMKKTGFKDNKIRNILNRVLKMGKIKRAGRGVYVGA